MVNIRRYISFVSNYIQPDQLCNVCRKVYIKRIITNYSCCKIYQLHSAVFEFWFWFIIWVRTMAECIQYFHIWKMCRYATVFPWYTTFTVIMYNSIYIHFGSIYIINFVHIRKGLWSIYHFHYRCRQHNIHKRGPYKWLANVNVNISGNRVSICIYLWLLIQKATHQDCVDSTPIIAPCPIISNNPISMSTNEFSSQLQ